MKPRIGVVITLGVLALVGLTSQLLLRQLKFFQVRSVELVGVEHLDREGVLDALDAYTRHRFALAGQAPSTGLNDNGLVAAG